MIHKKKATATKVAARQRERQTERTTLLSYSLLKGAGEEREKP